MQCRRGVCCLYVYILASLRCVYSFVRISDALVRSMANEVHA